MKTSEEWIYILRPVRGGMLSDGPTPEEAEVLEEHYKYLRDLTEQGVVMLAGRTLRNDERTLGLVLLRSDSEEEGRRIMNEDPAVRRGLMAAELEPFRISLMEATEKRPWEQEEEV